MREDLCTLKTARPRCCRQVLHSGRLPGHGGGEEEEKGRRGKRGRREDRGKREGGKHGRRRRVKVWCKEKVVSFYLSVSLRMPAVPTICLSACLPPKKSAFLPAKKPAGLAV